MLSPDGSKAAPSIWSFDSGYGSGEGRDEEVPRNGAFYLQASTSSNSLDHRLESTENVGLGLGFSSFQFGDRIQPKIEEPAIDPIVTKLSVFTTKETHEQDFFLPEFSSEGEGCLTCEFWKITNPGEDIRCEDCRLPDIIEPSLLMLNDPKGKEPMSSIKIPASGRKDRPSVPQSSPHFRCSACELAALINPSGSSSCPSCAFDSGLLSPASPPSSKYRVKRSRAGRNSKLPLSALNRLQSWLDAHQDNPYPSGDEKRQLALDCGITEKQVTTWFTNARARQLNPLETYLSSASEDEAAQESDIASAAQTPVYTSGFTYLSENQAQGRSQGYRRAGSVSGSSAFSGSQSRPQPSRRGKKKNYRRNNNLSPQIAEQSPFLQSTTTLNEPIGDNQEMWQCTFCRRHLVPKSWRRHEETQHRPRAQWTCMLFGPRLSFPHRAGSCCAFCMQKDPSEDHFLNNHRISECAKRPSGERTFFRPDHLRQHVKNFHGATLFDVAQSRWKKGAEEVGEQDGWVCGFCGEGLETWDRRETHIANHFKEGMTMSSWRDYPLKRDIDMKKEKKHGQDKDSKSEKEHSAAHGLARLSRTFTRRNTRSSKTPHTQPQAPSSVPFSNAFDPLPTSIPISLDPIHHFSAPPVLPDINMDPLMGTYNNFVDVDWTAVTQPQYSNNVVYDPSQASLSQQSDFDSNLDNVLNYGNSIDYHGPWNGQS